MDRNSEKGMCGLELYLYIGFACSRIIFALLPQTGYIHPDEYFQSLEFILGDVYQVNRSRVWEFDDQFPIRNTLIPVVLYGIPCSVIKIILQVFQFFGPVSPYLLVIPPRMVLCILSFLVDFSLMRICKMQKIDVGSRMTFLASSWIMLVFAIRTFSNTIEMILFSLLLFVIVKNIFEADKSYPIERKLKTELETATNPREKVLILRQLKQIAHHDHNGFWQIAVLLVCGVFNRPTFIAFAVSPLFFWLYRGAAIRQISFQTVKKRFAYLLTVAIPVTIGFIVFDTIYYRKDRTLEIILDRGLGICLNRFLDCFEITPLNFLAYNLDSENLAKHGVHPRYLHLLVNIPLLYNVLGMGVIRTICTIISKSSNREFRTVPKFDSITGLMIGSVIVPLAILSIAPHQEPRFLIPLIVPLIFLKGMKRSNGIEDTEYCFRSLLATSFTKHILFVWYFANLLFVFLFGFFHQAGILPAINHIVNVQRDLKDGARIHIIPSYTYNLPLTLLHSTIHDDKTERSAGSNIILYPSTSSNLNVSMKYLEMTMKRVEEQYPYDDLVYYIFPTSLTTNFTNHQILKNLEVEYTVEYYYPLHISTEALPSFSNLISNIGLNVVLLRSTKYRHSPIEDFELKNQPSLN